MKDVTKKRVFVFFTLGTTLRHWRELGILERETSVYRKLADSGFEVTFVTYGDADDLALANQVRPLRVFAGAEGFNTRSLESGKPGFLALFLSLLIPFRVGKLISKGDVIKTNQMWGSWTAWLTKLMTGAFLVVRCGYELHHFSKLRKRANWKTTLVRVVSWLAYHLANRIVLTSEADRKYVIKTFGVSGEKIQVIPNFIDTQKFAPREREERSGRLISVGRLDSQKNYGELIHTVAELKIGLDLIGEGPLIHSLRELASTLDADVRFLGRISNEELPDLLSSSRAFVLPSLYEGHPKALLEAMSCAVPVIGARSTGISEVIQDGVTGFLTKPLAPEMTETIRKLQTLSEERVEKLGAQARDWVISHCSLERVAEMERELYRGDRS